jgi:hypothetical protein
MYAMSNGGRLAIEHLETGLDFGSTEIPEGAFPTPDQFWLELLEKLVIIQEKTNKIIPLPADEQLTSDTIETIFSTASKIETGKALYQPGELKITGGAELAQSFVQGFADRQLHYITSTYNEEQFETIFGVEIPLGPVTVFCEKVYMKDEDYVELSHAFQNVTKDAEFVIKLQTGQDALPQAYFPRWLPAAAIKQLPFTIPEFNAGSDVVDSES